MYFQLPTLSISDYFNEDTSLLDLEPVAVAPNLVSKASNALTTLALSSQERQIQPASQPGSQPASQPLRQSASQLLPGTSTPIQASPQQSDYVGIINFSGFMCSLY